MEAPDHAKLIPSGKVWVCKNTGPYAVMFQDNKGMEHMLFTSKNLENVLDTRDTIERFDNLLNRIPEGDE